MPGLPDRPYDSHPDVQDFTVRCSSATAGLVMTFLLRETNCSQATFSEVGGKFRPMHSLLYKTVIVKLAKPRPPRARRYHLPPLTPSASPIADDTSSQKNIQSP
jgi:hypothetical protein